MTLVQLRHLISLAQTGSFRRSAEALFITQPALSRSIATLEDELGQPLFDRVGWRTELTAFGAEVLEHARRLVDGAQALKESAQRLDAGERGRLRLGLGSGPAAILAAPLLRHMALNHPGAQLELSRGRTPLLERALRERELDAMVVDLRSVPPSPQLHIEPLAELKGAFLCRPDHPLTRIKPPLRFRDVLRYPVASTPLSDEIGRILVERYGPQAHQQDFITLRCDDLTPLLDVARQTDTILVAVHAAAPDMVELNLRPAFNATGRFGMVTLAHHASPPLLSLIRAPLRELLTDQ